MCKAARVIGDMVIADAVVHPYNLEPGNQNPEALPQLEAVYAAHTMSVAPEQGEYCLTREEFFSDVSYETIASALFVESDVDFAVIHALPNLGFARTHVTEPRRAAAFRDAHPERFALYATVDTHLTAAAIAELRSQVDELGVDGLKLYPAFFYDGLGEGWRLDGEDFAIPLIEAAHEMGIRRVAVHKALWLPPAPKEAFRIDDFGGALEHFPDIDFFMVHAGMAFKEQTAELLERHPNLHATLESMFAYILVRPDRFADILGRLLAACGSERLLFGSGANLMHPHPIIEAFAGYELPEAVLEQYGIDQLTDADRRNILGANALRLHGREPEAVRAAVAGDEYAQAREAGRRAPWSVLRERDGALR
jgi:predicted TIM-barrel fold metal-dependent hydrolase